MNAVQLDIAGLATAIDSYEVDYEHLPANLAVLNTHQPFAATYIKANISLVDAWGIPYSYSVLSNRYELRSAGPDRVLKTVDDIIWNENNTGKGVAGYRRQSAPQSEP